MPSNVFIRFVYGHCAPCLILPLDIWAFLRALGRKRVITKFGILIFWFAAGGSKFPCESGRDDWEPDRVQGLPAPGIGPLLKHKIPNSVYSNVLLAVCVCGRVLRSVHAANVVHSMLHI